MGRGQSQNPQGGQMGGMGQPGGIPGGGIASLAPQMGGQMGGFGQMVNQAVSQPGMVGATFAPGRVGATFDPQLGMGQPGMLGMGQVGGPPGMGQPGQRQMPMGGFGQPDQASMQAQLDQMNQARQRQMGGTAPNAPAMNQFNDLGTLMQSQAQGRFDALGMGPQRGMGGQMPRPQGGPLSTMVNPPRPMPGGQMQGGQMGGMGQPGMGQPGMGQGNTLQQARRIPLRGLASMFRGMRSDR